MNPLLTPPQVAKYMRVSRDKVLNWIRSGRLKAINVADLGKRPMYRIAKEDIDALAVSLTVPQAGRPQKSRTSNLPSKGIV